MDTALLGGITALLASIAALISASLEYRRRKRASPKL